MRRLFFSVAVRGLEDNQISEWALRTGARFEVRLPELESSHRGSYADGRRSGSEASAAADLLDRLGVWDECLVWIRAWGASVGLSTQRPVIDSSVTSGNCCSSC
jgi:hypothetical protein